MARLEAPVNLMPGVDYFTGRSLAIVDYYAFMLHVKRHGDPLHQAAWIAAMDALCLERNLIPPDCILINMRPTCHAQNVAGRDTING